MNTEDNDIYVENIRGDFAYGTSTRITVPHFSDRQIL